MRNDERGFTLTELLILLALLAITVFWVIALYIGITGNFWFTDEGVLKSIQFDHPEVVKIIKTERNVTSYSKIYVENEDGSRSVYSLDSCATYDYELKRLKEH